MSARNAAPVFAALGDETRLRLVSRLTKGSQSIAALSSGANVTRQAITKHLSVLARAGLVRSRRRGRERHWQLEAKKLEDAQHWLEVIGRQWDEKLERLRAHVE